MKTLITGTGRCGTSFLMHLLTELGQNTGYTKEEAHNAIRRHKGLNAGIEHSAKSKRWKKSSIVKSPFFASIENLELVIDEISHVIIPIRNLEASAKSRAKANENVWHSYGGFVDDCETIEQQQDYNAKLIYNLVEYLEQKGISYEFIHFPRMVQDPQYLYNKLLKRFSLSWITFYEVFNKIADPSKVHEESSDNS